MALLKEALLRLSMRNDQNIMQGRCSITPGITPAHGTLRTKGILNARRVHALVMLPRRGIYLFF